MTLQEPCKLSLQDGTGWAMCCLAQWKTGFALPGTTFRVRQLSWDSTLALVISYVCLVRTYVTLTILLRTPLTYALRSWPWLSNARNTCVGATQLHLLLFSEKISSQSHNQCVTDMRSTNIIALPITIIRRALCSPNQQQGERLQDRGFSSRNLDHVHF